MTAALVFVGADGRQRPAPVSAAWWVGMLAAVPAGAVMVCRVLAAQGRLDLGACPAAAGATTAAWLMVAVAAASARSGDDFELALLFCGLCALLAGVATYVAVELANGLCCCRCCGQRATAAAAAAAEPLAAASHDGSDEQTGRRGGRLGRPLTVLGAAVGLGLGVLIGVAADTTDNDPDWLVGLVFCGPPLAIAGAAAAHFLVEAYGVDGATDASGWLTYDLALLSFGRRRHRQQQRRQKMFALSCNFGDCHNMACGPLARLPALRNLFRVTNHFSFWGQAVSLRPPAQRPQFRTILQPVRT